MREKWLGLQQAMHSGYYTLFIRSFNSIFLFNEFSWRDHKLYKDLSTDLQYRSCINKTYLFSTSGVLSLLFHFDTVTDVTL